MSEYFCVYIYYIYSNIDIFNKSCHFKVLSPNKTDI